MSDAQSFSYPSGLSRRNLLQAGSIVLLLGRQHIAHGATIVAVRVWPAPEYTRVTIESDRPLAAKQFFVDQPPRLAVDIEGIDLNPALRELVAKVRSDDPNIASIRVGQNSPSVVRLVIDLKQPAKPQVFTLQPVAAYKHRLVFDLYPAKAVDPLEALISERLRDASGDDTAVAAAPPPPLGACGNGVGVPWARAKKGAAQAAPRGVPGHKGQSRGHSLMRADGAARPQRRRPARSLLLPIWLPTSAPAAAPPTVPSVVPNRALPSTPPATAPTPVPSCALLGRWAQPPRASAPATRAATARLRPMVVPDLRSVMRSKVRRVLFMACFLLS